MPTVFLSHSHEDKAFARRLARDLRSAGVTVWIDEAALGIGDSLINSIAKALDSTDFLVVMLSKNSVSSEWVNREVEIALNDEISGGSVKVLPLMIENCEIPAFLRGKAYGDFRQSENYEQELSRLLVGLGIDSSLSSSSYVVIFDESFRQAEWFAQPLVSAGYSRIAQCAAEEYSVTTNPDGYSTPDSLPVNAILVLPTPFGMLVADEHYQELIKWVNRGGRLLFFGIYLMEAHHYNNLNKLARRLGLEFAKNLTMPKGREDFRECMDQAFSYAKREYWIQTSLTGDPPGHLIL